MTVASAVAAAGSLLLPRTRRWLAIVLGVGGGGVLLAALVAENAGWTSWTLSQLSADPIAGPVFRASLVVTGVAALGLAWAVDRALAMLCAGGLVGRRWARCYRAGTWTVGPALAIAGLVPLGVSPALEIIHGVAAYTAAILVLAGMLTAHLAVRALGDRFGRASLTTLAAILVVYLVAVFEVVSYAAMEIVALGAATAWVTAFVDRVARLADEAAGSVDRVRPA